jgi:two-component system, response regulator
MDILLVEDNANDAELAMLALQRARFSGDVVRAEDGLEALKMLGIRDSDSPGVAGAVPRVVFLDLKLPKIDGLQVLEQLKSHERTRQIPVVMLTSSREETDVETAYRLGVNSYIVKPVNFDEYQSAIASLAQYWTRLNQTSPSLA